MDAFLHTCFTGVRHTEVAGDPCAATFYSIPQRGGGIRSIFPKRIKVEIEPVKPFAIVVVIARDAFEGIEAGVLRRHAVTHVLDDCMRSGDPDILFASAGGSRSADVLIDIEAPHR